MPTWQQSVSGSLTRGRASWVVVSTWCVHCPCEVPRLLCTPQVGGGRGESGGVSPPGDCSLGPREPGTPLRSFITSPHPSRLESETHTQKGPGHGAETQHPRVDPGSRHPRWPERQLPTPETGWRRLSARPPVCTPGSATQHCTVPAQQPRIGSEKTVASAPSPFFPHGSLRDLEEKQNQSHTRAPEPRPPALSSDLLTLARGLCWATLSWQGHPAVLGEER